MGSLLLKFSINLIKNTKDMNTENVNKTDSNLPIFGVSDSFVNNLTVGSLIEKLNFAIENGYITNEHTILIGGNGDTCLVQNLTLPSVALDNSKEFKQVQMLFTKL
jgi:hypothetical protein